MSFLFRESIEKRQQRLLFLGLGIMMAGLFNFLFWDQQLGLNFILFITLSLGLFLSVAWHTKQIKQKSAFWLLIPIFILSLDILFYTNNLAHGFVPVFTVALLLLFFITVTLDNPERHRFQLAQIPLLRRWYLPLTKIRHIYNDIAVWEKGTESQMKRVLIGIIIALPFLLIFTFLFINADAVFENWIQEAFNFEINENFFGRFIQISFLSLVFVSGFYVLIGRDHTLGGKMFKAWNIDRVIVSTVLSLLNALFLIFVFIQIRYLFGGVDVILQNDMTYAEYARHGFFELVAVMVIAGGLILFTYRSFAEHGASKFLKFLQLLLLVQVGIIAVSALKRMNLYQDAYGYTVLRLYVEWFIYFALLVLFASGISLLTRFSYNRFFSFLLLGSLIAFTLVASINVDKMIAKENVDRGIAGKEFDKDYLLTLSPDAWSEVIRAQNSGLITRTDETVMLLKANNYDDWRETNYSIEFMIHNVEK